MEGKDFELVTELSRKFLQFAQSVAATDYQGSGTNSKILLWQARIQLAIAQQMTMIAHHLDDMASEVERMGIRARKGAGE